MAHSHMTLSIVLGALIGDLAVDQQINDCYNR